MSTPGKIDSYLEFVPPVNNGFVEWWTSVCFLFLMAFNPSQIDGE